MRPPSRLRLQPSRYSAATPQSETMASGFLSRKRKASVEAADTRKSGQIEGTSEQGEVNTGINSGKTLASGWHTRANMSQTQHHGRRRGWGTILPAFGSPTRDESSDEEELQTKTTAGNPALCPEDTHRTWEEYQEILAAEARESATPAAMPITQAATMAHNTMRAQGDNARVVIKQEPADLDEDIMFPSTEQGNEGNNTPPVFIKQSIEEEEEVKPAVEEQEDVDDMEVDSAHITDQLQEISAATFAPSGTHRDKRAMMDQLVGMDLTRPAREERSVAPRDFSAQRARSVGHPFAPRYKSRTVTRGQYKKHVAETYDPDVEAGEEVMRKEVLKNRKQRVSGGKIVKTPYGQKSSFMLAVEARTLVKERAESSMSQYEEEEELSEDDEMQDA